MFEELHTAAPRVLPSSRRPAAPEDSPRHRYSIIRTGAVIALFLGARWWYDEAPVDNECLGKSRQVGGDGKSWEAGYWELG